MRSVNSVTLIGNLTRDPEMRQTSGGQPIVTFGMATNREWVDNNGQKQSLPEYHNVVAWGKLAELCNELLKKGDLVYIQGYLKTRSWDHESGIKVYRCEIVAQDMIKLNRSHGGGNSGNSSNGDNDDDKNQDDTTSNDGSDMPLDDDDDFFADLEKETTQ